MPSTAIVAPPPSSPSASSTSGSIFCRAVLASSRAQRTYPFRDFLFGVCVCLSVCVFMSRRLVKCVYLHTHSVHWLGGYVCMSFFVSCRAKHKSMYEFLYAYIVHVYISIHPMWPHLATPTDSCADNYVYRHIRLVRIIYVYIVRKQIGVVVLPSPSESRALWRMAPIVRATIFSVV